MINKLLKFNIKKDVIMPLILVNVLFFIIQTFTGGIEGWFTKMFVLVSADVMTRPWIILTSMFLHASTMHILFNMYALYIFGPLIQQRIGPKRFLLAYFAGGIIAGIAFTIFNPASSALGASGAIMTILGLVIMLMPHLRVLFFFVVPMSMRTAGIIFAAIDLIGFVSPFQTGIAHVAHLAGLTVGLFYGYQLLKKRKAFTQKIRNRPKLDLSMSQNDIDEYFKDGRI